MTFIFKEHYLLYEKEPVIKVEKEETNCLLNVAEKGSVNTFFKVQVKGITVKLPVQEQAIKVVREKEAACWIEERTLCI